MKIYEQLKEDWDISKKAIKELGIDPDKEWGDITLDELSVIAEYLDVTVSEMV